MPWSLWTYYLQQRSSYITCYDEQGSRQGFCYAHPDFALGICAKNALDLILGAVLSTHS
jgi:hypothetical protein